MVDTANKEASEVESQVMIVNSSDFGRFVVPADYARSLEQELADERDVSKYRTVERDRRFEEAQRWEKGFHEQRKRAEQAEAKLVVQLDRANELARLRVNTEAALAAALLDAERYRFLTLQRADWFSGRSPLPHAGQSKKDVLDVVLDRARTTQGEKP